MKVLSQAALNRATLARQLLLERHDITSATAIEKLVGLQAQEARPPFVGLWTRLAKFRREDLCKLLLSRKVVRGSMMRMTIHLMTARDYVRFRGVMQPAMSAAMGSLLKRVGTDIKIEDVVAEARQFFHSNHARYPALLEHLAKIYPRADARILGLVVRTHLPVLQLPTETKWAFPGSCDFTSAETWLRVPLSTDSSPQELALRYLAGFGPASVADAAAWSGLRNLKPVFEALRAKLLTFRDESGRELFDLPKAPRPPQDTPAPPRFLPDYDNLILGHADRTRFIAPEHRPRLITKNLRVPGTFLIDGRVAGVWDVKSSPKQSELVLRPFSKIDRASSLQLQDEGERLVRFIDPETADHIVRIAAPG